MNIFKAIKAIFIKPVSIRTMSAEELHSFEEYVRHSLITIEEKIPGVVEKFDADFNSFFFNPEIEMIIKDELLPVAGYRGIYAGFLDNDHWQAKHPLNFPGPFYTGESDTCGTGDREAPGNVLYDDYCCEYIFKQPQNYTELLCVLSAAAVEVFDSYSCNGNTYWTYAACKEWWRNRSSVISQLNDPELKGMNHGREQLYIDYLHLTAEKDLKKYCFFLENNYYPGNENILPDL